jgi:hypothetical protein
MTETLKAVIVDAATGEVIERPLTADEISHREELAVEAEAQQVETQARIAARESALAKLAALGLTADEVAAL